MIELTVEIVIDTSAILAVVGLAPERAELIRLTEGDTLVAPSSVHWEIGNALSAMFKRKAINLDEALRMIDAYSAIPIRIADPTLRQAAELSSQLNICAYDAYIIGCAINQQAPILSMDRVLIDKAKSMDIKVIEIAS